MIRQRSVAAALSLFAACHSAPPPAATPAPDASAAALEALYRARLDSARMRFTEADVRFVNGMIAHHAQALVMAQMALANDASEAVRVLAARITNAQQDEIALMQQWLRDREQPVAEVHADSGGPMLHDTGQHAHLPGMLTTGQLAALKNARGPEFDRMFLSYMIRHHRGAILMVEGLVRTDGAAQDPLLYKLAAEIQADQLAEIVRMQRLLAALGEEGDIP